MINLKQYLEVKAAIPDRIYLTIVELNPKISFARAGPNSRIWGEVVLMDKVDETNLPYPRGGELSDDDDTALVDDERNFSNPDAADPIYATDEEDDPEPSTPDIHDGITDAVLTNVATSDDDDIASDVVDDCGNLSHRYDADDSKDAEDEEDDPEPSTHDIHDGISNAVRMNRAACEFEFNSNSYVS